MKIEAGKCYRARDGEKWTDPKPAEPTSGAPNRAWTLEDANGDEFSFTEDGRFCVVYAPEHELIAEWEDRNDTADAMAYAFVGLDLASKDIKAEIADEAKRIVTGARRSAYGTPESNFERIARFWQAYFENTGRGDLKITAADVSPLMRLMKEARLAETPDHYDSYVDLVGYSLTGAEVCGVRKP